MNVPFPSQERRRSGPIYKAVRRKLVPRERRRRQRVKHGYPLPPLTEFRDTSSCCVQTACRMDLFTKAKELGIQAEFIDGQGHRRVTDPAALKIILEALPASTPHRLVSQPVVIRSGQPSRIEFSQAATFPLRWKIVS